jgi:hypothetical protein
VKELTIFASCSLLVRGGQYGFYNSVFTMVVPSDFNADTSEQIGDIQNMLFDDVRQHVPTLKSITMLWFNILKTSEIH